MRTWKQICEEERFYEVCRWVYSGDENDPYEVETVGSELTLEEAKELFDNTQCSDTVDMIDVYMDYYDTEYDGITSEKIATKDNSGWETWDKSEL